MKITKANVGKLVCPPGQDEVAFADDEVSGLVLRTRSSGARAWYLRFRDAHGRSHRLKIGDAKALSPDDARELARKAVRDVAGGANPVAERKAARQAVLCEELFGLYLAHAETVQRPSTFVNARRHLTRNCASIAKEPVATLSRATVRELRDRLLGMVGPVQANRTLTTLSGCWSWALRNGIIPEGSNPASYIDKYPEQARERVLTMDELRAIWKGTRGGSRYDRLVRTIILTVVRRAEAGGMAWSELNGNLWTVPAARMKGGVAHEVVLPALALEQLPARDNYRCVFGTETPFGRWSGAKTRLNKAVGFDDWGLHDVRRTFSTEMNARKLADPHIVEAVLAHIGAKGGVAGVYNMASYRQEKAAALEAWVQLLKDEGVFDAAP